jgi:hypothetical protein
LAPASRRRVADLGASLILTLAAFFHSAHVGHLVEEDEIGRFRSYFTAEALRRLDAARTAAWRNDPPVGMPLLGKQDYYLTEGGWHAQLRNTAYRARDFRTAWFENRILEKYYAAFLDIRSFSSAEVHRWAPAQREEVRAGLAAGPPGTYTSLADANRIYLRPTGAELWSLALVATAALIAVSWRARPTRDLRNKTGRG